MSSSSPSATRCSSGGRAKKRGGAAKDGDAKPQTGHRPREQLELLQVEREHELDAPDHLCPSCGGQLGVMAGQFEESDEVDVLERQFVLVHHKRKKYRCSCGGCVETAPGPEKLIPSGRYSIDFAVSVAIAKYADHLPLERQARMMKRQGLLVDSQTLWDQINGSRGSCNPSAKPCRATSWRSLWLALTRPSCDSWKATATTSAGRHVAPKAVSYRILDSPSAASAGEVVGDFHGTLLVDGYSG